MRYIAIDIDSWLEGSMCQTLNKAEVGVWTFLLVLGGRGKGRFGFIELAKDIPYSRQKLLSLCNCYTDEDVQIFDSCMKKCLNGYGGDDPRLLQHQSGVYEIINWDKYQSGLYPKGLTETEAKAFKK